MKWRILALALCAFAISACDDGETQKTTCGDAICTESQDCVNELCVEKSALCGDIKCTDTQKCIDDLCIEKSELCGDVMCTQSQTCLENLCVESKVLCGEVECKIGEICNDKNECVADDADCDGKKCDANSVCIDKVCTLKTDLCGDRKCSATQTCIVQNCIENAALCGGKLCADDEECIDLTCDVIVKKCKTFDDCVDGWDCNTVTGKCEEKTTGDCQNCAFWQACNPYTNKCIPAYGYCGIKADCYPDQNCDDSSHLCTGGKLPEPEGNVVPNWDFEDWVGAKPAKWNIEEDFGGYFTVSDEKAKPRSGQHAAKISNSAKQNGRLVSDPVTLETGKYTCSAWLNGLGNFNLGARLTSNSDNKTYHYAGSSSLYGGTDYAVYNFSFTVAADTKSTEIIIAISDTEKGSITVDAISCIRLTNKCDKVVCEDWEICKPVDGLCAPVSGRCNDNTQCASHRECNIETHTCVFRENRCDSTLDCNSTLEAPKTCNKKEHQCEDINPCDSVTCADYMLCNVVSGKCELKEGSCLTSKDCLKDKPACDVLTHTCNEATHPCNIFPNGGFESWNEYELPYQPSALIPDEWFGYFEDLVDHKYATEIKAENVKPYTASTHSGNYAMQVIFPKRPAERLTSEDFHVPSGKYTCSYWVRGKGSIRHRSYSTLGDSPYTDFVSVDSLDWQRIAFDIRSNARYMRLVFYVSDTDASKDHIQIDDVVCTKD